MATKTLAGKSVRIKTGALANPRSGIVRDIEAIRDQDRADIQDFLDWLAKRGRSERTRWTYQQAAEHLATFTAEKGMPALADVTREHIEDFLGAMWARGLKPATVRNRYGGIRAFFNWAAESDVRRDHPMARIKPPQVPDQVQPDYTIDQIAALLASIPTRLATDFRDRALVAVLFDCGLRSAELCDIRLGDVNRESRRITIETGKGGKGRVVGYSYDTQDMLNRYLRKRGGGWDRLDKAAPLFAAQNGSPLTPNAVRMLMKRRFATAGLEFRGTHAFRRGWGQAALDAGMEPMDLKELAGWSSLTMLYRYTKRTARERALKNVDQFSPMARVNKR